MSGIFGYIGSQHCKQRLIHAIHSLKSRGGDSAGIALRCDDETILINTLPDCGELAVNENEFDVDATIGLAQTCKSFRCPADKISCTPAANNLFAVAIDGNIDNFESLKKWTNSPFTINTDEDLLLAVLSITNQNDKLEMFRKIDLSIHGYPTYAFICRDDSALYCKKGSAPLIIGIGEDGFYISSQLDALIGLASKYILMHDGEYAKITKNKALVLDSNFKRVKKTIFTTPEKTLQDNSRTLADEIYYCPLIVKETLASYVKNAKLDFDYLKLTRHTIDRLSRIIITGTSSDLNTARISGYNFEMLSDIPVTVKAAGELKHSGMVIDKNTLLIAISHTGEDADTIACAKKIRSCGGKTIALTGGRTSYLAQICGSVIHSNAPYDNCDSSLTAFIANYFTMCLFALYVGWKNSVVTDLYLNVTIKMAEMLPGKISTAIKNTPLIEKAAEKFLCAKNVFVTGLGSDYALSFEAAQRLRELAKINASAYCCSELVSTAGLLDDYALVLAIITNKELMEKPLYYLRRAKILGAKIIIITTSNIEEEISGFDTIIALNDSVPVFNSIPCITAIYKLAIAINDIRTQNDIDKGDTA